jgi:hypothetical protein
MHPACDVASLPRFNAQKLAERKRLVALDEAFCASVTAAIKRGQEKEPNLQALPE